MDKVKDEILNLLIPELRTWLEQISFSDLSEIRLRSERPVLIGFGSQRNYREVSPDHVLRQEVIERQLTAFLGQSVYAHRENLRSAYITVAGGHRIGFSGSAVTEEGKMVSMRHVNGINIRLARSFPGCSAPLVPLIRYQNRICNTLIISPPGVGKTTVLRDIARVFGDEKNICIIDERGEIAAMHNGVSRFNIGMRTDVFDGFRKAYGMECAMRSMNPDVMITDEIGDEEDVSAILAARKGGCAFICSMHGSCIDDVKKTNPNFAQIFERYILLARSPNGLEVAAWEKGLDAFL